MLVKQNIKITVEAIESQSNSSGLKITLILTPNDRFLTDDTLPWKSVSINVNIMPPPLYPRIPTVRLADGQETLTQTNLLDVSGQLLRTPSVSARDI